MSIHDLPDKIKRKTGLDNTTFLYLFLIVGVGISAFGLGRLSVSNNPEKDTDIQINQTAGVYTKQTKIPTIKTSINTPQIQSNIEKNYVASKNGKLYYTVNCKGVNRIKEENRVWFDTASDAEKLGYSMSSSCK